MSSCLKDSLRSGVVFVTADAPRPRNHSFATTIPATVALMCNGPHMGQEVGIWIKGADTCVDRETGGRGDQGERADGLRDGPAQGVGARACEQCDSSDCSHTDEVASSRNQPRDLSQTDSGRIACKQVAKEVRNFRLQNRWIPQTREIAPVPGIESNRLEECVHCILIGGCT